MGSPTGVSDEQPLQEFTVIDSDVHVEGHIPEIAKMVAERMEMPYSHLLHPDKGSGSYGFPRSGAHSEIPGKMSVFNFEGFDPVLEPSDIDDTLRAELGVDYPVINMTPMWDVYPDTDQILQEMPATNDVLLEEFLDSNDDYFGSISIQTREPEAAVEEIERLADERQMVAVLVHPGGQERGLGDSRYDPIWAAAEDNDLAIAFHTTATGQMWEMPGIIGSMSTMPELHTLSHPYSMMWVMTSLILEGTPAKFPDLNFIFLESGIGWVPYMMSRLNREYSTWRSQAPLLEKMPEEYIRDQFYFGTQPLGEFSKRSHMADIIDIVGSGNILFSTDFPHFDIDNPETIRGFFSHLSEEEQCGVFGENAIDAFGLPI
ncbi:amidohydrolase family protein [Halostagnicola sp. A-GB9-2]|uniref:amidohydrolase family protein n=1 Tax=Halostagnicola sp. A-GB9-2 TaxID=3048066 RepID=UPI0024BFBA2D|nr:amidohydrolase family protein [Halostagnicola sp. A-GB9-2]MDJ1434399.1 amidohydrolase family protein [Halostagnicola sp. A-GB9-2]